MKWRDQTITLVRKADEDMYILRSHVEDPGVSDEMWGFHAQQAVEKLIKALLSHRQIRYPFTHRLRELADLAKDSGNELPGELDPVLDLTPYAAELRYSLLPPHEIELPLNRGELLSLIGSLRQFVCLNVGL